MLRSARSRITAVAASALMIAGGAGAYAASAATTVPPASSLYGCVTGTNRVLEHVYTVESNFVSYLNANGGTCPAGSFAVNVASGAGSPSPSPAPTSPSPAPTSASPSPAPTGAPRFELTALDRSQTPGMTDANVSGGSNDSGPSVRQEVWNPKPALRKQDTRVWGPGTWVSTVNAAAGNTECNSYPDVSDTVTRADGTPNPVSGYSSLVSTYAENMNATSGTDAEAAYDIWLNGYANELMIWVDDHGQTPLGTDTGKTLTAGGNTYRVLDYGAHHDTVSLILDHNAQSGTTDILSLVRDLQAMGYYSASAGFDQVDFGFETPSTGGVDENFTVSGYTLKYS